MIAMTCILAVPAVMVYMFVKEWYYGPRLNNKEVQSRSGTIGSTTRRYSQGVVLQAQ